MKNKSKIILGIIGVLVLIIVIIFLLIYFKIIYNPFINNRDLECSRTNDGADQVYTFEFDWLARLTSARTETYISFETFDEAKEYYNLYNNQDFNIFIEDNTVKFIGDYVDANIPVEELQTRKEIMNDYIYFGYKCE